MPPDFAALQAFALCFVFKSTSLCLADLPAGLKAWWDVMVATKGVKAVLAKGVALMPGGKSKRRLEPAPLAHAEPGIQL